MGKVTFDRPRGQTRAIASERAVMVPDMSDVLGMACLCKPRKKAYRGMDRLDKGRGSVSS